jgi:hypothetical protein
MHRALTVVSLAVATAAIVNAPGQAGEGEPQKRKLERIVIHAPHGDHGAKVRMLDPAQIPGDHLEIDDLDSLAAGESRDYTSDGGREVTVTRLEGEGERYTLRTGETEIELGGDHEAELAGAGEARQKRIVIRRDRGDREGSDVEIEEEVLAGPATDLAIATDGEPPLVIEIVGERDGKALRRVIVLKTHEVSAGE